MADKKRKTLQIKRPDPNSVKSKKKPLPKVNMDQNAATSAVDTDQLSSMGPTTAKLKRPDENSLSGNNGKTIRIALPDEDKIRKARRANATQDLVAEDALPSAEQIAHAQKNATMPIMIDTESVEDNSSKSLNDTDGSQAMDRTMEIDAEALSTGNLENELRDAAQIGDVAGDQTMQIDPAALATGNLEASLKAANTPANPNDQTLQIDPDALTTSNLTKSLQEADQTEGDNDQTLQIDQDALAAAVSQDTQMLDDPEDSTSSDKTMQMDPAALATGNVDPVGDDALLSMETMQMDPLEDEDLGEEDPGTELTLEEMKESFNAQTMEMDASMLADELAKKNSGQFEAADDEDRSQTMDLTSNRPKTIMIKRPSKQGASNSATPTVKAVRPDAATVRTARPVTANTAQPKQDTSRIDVPGEATGGKEGKTIKLRRPAGATPSRSKSQISRVAGNAGLTLNEDGSVTAIAKAEEQLGAGWLAVAIITFLISAGAVWSIYAQLNPEVPMPGRLVDVNNQLVVSVD